MSIKNRVMLTLLNLFSMIDEKSCEEAILHAFRDIGEEKILRGWYLGNLNNGDIARYPRIKRMFMNSIRAIEKDTE